MTQTDGTIAPSPPLYVSVARGCLARALGLLLRPRLADDQALLFPRCSLIHTFGMRYPIDVVFLDTLGRVVRVVPELAPWRLAMQAGAAAVLGLSPGSAVAFGIVVGAHMTMLRPIVAVR